MRIYETFHLRQDDDDSKLCRMVYDNMKVIKNVIECCDNMTIIQNFAECYDKMTVIQNFAECYMTK